jgi:DNA-directed RNA polymerase subunit RPC12/RpoP
MGRARTYPGEGSWDVRRWASLSDTQKIEYHIKKRYKLSYKAWISLFETQDYKCATCEEEVVATLGNANNRGVVDHCHVTHVVRGILCHNCNRTLGLVKDNVETLRKMMVYLGKNSLGHSRPTRNALCS